MFWWTLQQLQPKDPQVRRQAVKKLASSGGGKALEALKAAMEDPDSEVREAVLKGIGYLNRPELEPLLIGGLGDAEPSVRAKAAEILKWAGSDQAIEPLSAALRDPSGSVRWQAVQSLEELGWQPRGPVDEAWRLVSLGQYEPAIPLGAAAIEPLTAALKDGLYYRRQAALEALSRIGDARVVKPILIALQDEDRNVRIAAVDALAQIADPASLEPMCNALSDPEPRVRAAIADALSRFNDSRATADLMRLLKDAHWEVRMAAASSLGKLKSAEALPALAQALEDNDREVREAAVGALMQIGDSKTVEHLVVCLKDDAESVRSLATRALRRIDQQCEKSDAARKAVPVLKAALKHKDYWVRQAAADTLSRIGEVRTVEPRLAHLLDAPFMRRQTAADIFIRLLKDFDNDFKQAAAEALGRMKEPKAVKGLVPLMQDADHWVCVAAARSLRSMEWQPGDMQQKRRQQELLATGPVNP